MKHILSSLVMLVSMSASAGWLDDLREKYLYSDYDSEGVEKSYNQADVYVPGNLFKTTPSNIDVTKKYPVVIYLHGCTGTANHDSQWGKYIADLGYIVVQPNTLARPNTKVICNPQTHSSEPGIATGKALMFRQQEIRYALKQVQQSTWADTSNIFLMGHSQGGVSTALNKINDFKGLVISGWTCTNSVTGGIKSANNIPVLAMAYDNDPWRKSTESSGRCIDSAPGRVNITQLDLHGNYHGTVDNPKAREFLKVFLKEYTNETR